ncbi:tRNA glutamyl-Q(34) synthetase GluQRS [Brackiella oedipodis]|uniref:tRNA glutamyl-Q(34) synthetase GluQRS n=1 Tax=Brackiella oedipodis TaxID=124225 RepID=UPI000AD05AE7|nr:tRNA glutamyl-Q(34) synthetase GluQRS [Brackiella oedipodis]
MNSSYIGRFAPSPSGPLHRGSLVAALASYLDAKAHHGQWRLRIEDIDMPRVIAGADTVIMQQLQHLGLHWQGPVLWQSKRIAYYDRLFAQLQAQQLIYGCACTRKEIFAVAPHPKTQAHVYPGTCRHGVPAGRQARAWRLKTKDQVIAWQDRWCGPQQQNVLQEVGDFIVKRADGLYAYQFVVVADDIEQGITHIVRGQDLSSSTARQMLLTHYLHGTVPTYLHVPLVLDDYGHKLSKQNHAPALDSRQPLLALQQAWQDLGFLSISATSVDDFLGSATRQWANRFGIAA